MTKADIIEQVHEKLCLADVFAHGDVVRYVEMALEAIKDALARGEHVKISGFGHFGLRQKRPRLGRNPQTGQELTIAARRIVTFKPSEKLKQVVNGQADD